MRVTVTAASRLVFRFLVVVICVPRIVSVIFVFTMTRMISVFIRLVVTIAHEIRPLVGRARDLIFLQ